MTTFIKTKFKISDDKTNIDKYRLAANITEYHIISKLILQRIMIHFYKLLWFRDSFEVNFNIGFGISIRFPSQRKKDYWIRSNNNEIMLWLKMPK